jgi:hypothetical protein
MLTLVHELFTGNFYEKNGLFFVTEQKSGTPQTERRF